MLRMTRTNAVEVRITGSKAEWDVWVSSSAAAGFWACFWLGDFPAVVSSNVWGLCHFELGTMPFRGMLDTCCSSLCL